jgi:hypothetical protein
MKPRVAICSIQTDDITNAERIVEIKKKSGKSWYEIFCIGVDTVEKELK